MNACKRAVTRDVQDWIDIVTSTVKLDPGEMKESVSGLNIAAVVMIGVVQDVLWCSG